ncbi:DMT family transporter [Pseudomonas sp. R1-6]|uniref:DMT family transporter n=1 Tax=Pseudomonas sp. R1-6 TaxID=2817397 RepID=UPI003DA8ABFC
MHDHDAPRPRLGIVLCLLSMLIFAAQDGVTKVLVKELPIAQLVMVRYWVFLAFAVGYSAYQGSLWTACRSRHPYQQIIRALIGVGESALFGLGLRYLGLAEMHALYAVFPLMTLALAGAFLGEFIGVRRWVAAAIGFTGTLVILRPGSSVFELAALIPLLSALGFAIFSVLTRRISRGDSFATNMLHMGFFGAIAITLLGLPSWVAPNPAQWGLIGAEGCNGSHTSTVQLFSSGVRYADWAIGIRRAARHMDSRRGLSGNCRRDVCDQGKRVVIPSNP